MEYLFTLLIPIVAVTIVVILAKHIASHTFKCKHCSKEFHIKWSKVIVTKLPTTNTCWYVRIAKPRTGAPSK